MLTGSLPVWAGWVWKRLEVRQNQPGEEVTSLLEMASLIWEEIHLVVKQQGLVSD